MRTRPQGCGATTARMCRSGRVMESWHGRWTVPMACTRLPRPAGARAGSWLLVGCSRWSTRSAAPPQAPRSTSVGEWRTLPQTSPINPIHVALLRTGPRAHRRRLRERSDRHHLSSRRVGSRRRAPSPCRTIPWDLFCNAMTFLPDGRVLTTGGNLQYNPFRGIRTTTVFDPATQAVRARSRTWRAGRWYPSNVALGRRAHDDVLGLAGDGRHQQRRRALHGAGRLERGALRAVHAAALPVAAPAARRPRVRVGRAGRLAHLQSRPPRRGRPTSPRRPIPTSGPTAPRCCCRCARPRATARAS